MCRICIEQIKCTVRRKHVLSDHAENYAAPTRQRELNRSCRYQGSIYIFFLKTANFPLNIATYKYRLYSILMLQHSLCLGTEWYIEDHTSGKNDDLSDEACHGSSRYVSALRESRRHFFRPSLCPLHSTIPPPHPCSREISFFLS